MGRSREISRRDLFKIAGGGAAVVLVDEVSGRRLLTPSLFGGVDAATVGLTIYIARPEDMALVRCDILNATVVGDRLVRTAGAQNIVIRAHLTPQSFGENASLGGASPPALGFGVATESTVSRAMNVSEMPYTVDAILDFSTTGLTNPETDLEIPYGIHFAPEPQVKLVGPSSPIRRETKGEIRYEVWNREVVPIYANEKIRLRGKGTVSNRPAELKDEVPTASTLRNILSQSQTSSQDAQVVADRILLTSLGATASLHGEWAAPATVAGWSQRLSIGRDVAETDIVRGRLYPFGIQVLKTTVARREMRSNFFSGRQAYITKQITLTVLEPKITYSNQAVWPGRQAPVNHFPFTSVEIGVKSLSIEEPAKGGLIKDPRGHTITFPLVAVDRKEQAVPLQSPLAFVPDNDNAALNAAGELFKEAQANGARIDAGGNRVALAPVSDPGSALPTFAISVKAPGPNTPCPAMDVAEVVHTAAAELGGTDGLLRVALDKDYAQSGLLDEAKGKVFARVVDDPASLPPLAADQLGSLVSPDLTPAALSDKFGMVFGKQLGVDQMLSGQFDPASLFGNSKLLGAISLEQILKNIPGGLSNVPGLSLSRTPNAVEAVWSWSTALNVNGTAPFFPAPGTRLELEARVKSTIQDGAPKEPEMRSRGSLGPFTLKLGGDLVTLGFGGIRFSSEPAKKPTFDIDLDSVHFGGVLGFIEKLQDILSGLGGPGGFAIDRIPRDLGVSPVRAAAADGADVDAKPDRITASASYAVPNVSIGVFSLRNIRIGGLVSLSIHGDFLTRFDFCTRDDQFELTVGIFGGGGYLGLVVGPAGLQLMEASLRFGGSYSLDIGVASGSAHLWAGVELSVGTNGTGHLGGYLDAGGALCVLGIVSLSVNFHAALSYDFKSHEVLASATVTVKVEVLMFEKSVRLHMEKRFGGKAGDPPFIDFYPQIQPWADYCAAFAA